MYLMIENDGVAPIESFTMLGVSTARSDSSKIGQFGSGSKHGVLVLLRQGISPTIFCGKDKLSFVTLPKVMEGTPYNQVAYSVNNRKPKELSYSTEFGELDWKDNIEMALREFISNALDQSGREGVRIETMSKPRAKEGCTRVFIKNTPEVASYICQIEKYFLHFGRKDRSQEIFLPKREKGPASIYRKGVFVRTVSRVWKKPSLFDYNLLDCKIDESRNMEDWTAAELVGRSIVGNKDAMISLFKSFKEGEEHWEHTFSDYYLYGADLDLMKQAAEQVFTSKDIPCTKSDFVIMALVKKGYNPIPMSNPWLTLLKNSGFKNEVSVLNDNERQGREEFAANETVLACRDEIWQWFIELQLTYGRPRPMVMMFDENSKDGEICQGYYDKKSDQIYINRDYANDRQTMLEEICHYISGAEDETRDFQNFSFKMIDRMAELLFE